jgi:hypothetical protein
MGYEVSYLVDKRVVFINLYGKLTMDDLRKTTAESRRLCEEGIPFVHVISDTSDLKVEMKVSDFMEMFRGLPPIPTVGWSVGVTSNSVHRFFFSIVAQLTHNKSRNFATMEEAIAFLQKADDTLPVIPIPRKVKQE